MVDISCPVYPSKCNQEVSGQEPVANNSQSNTPKLIHHLNSRNVMEYSLLAWTSAAPTTFRKFDTMEDRADCFIDTSFTNIQSFQSSSRWYQLQDVLQHLINIYQSASSTPTTSTSQKDKARKSMETPSPGSCLPSHASACQYIAVPSASLGRNLDFPPSWLV